MPTRRPARKPVRRRAPRVRNPDVVSRIYHDRLAAKEFRVTEDELTGHMYMAEDADALAKAIAAFSRQHGSDAHLLTSAEWDVLGEARRILLSIAIPRSTFRVIERRPFRYPGKR